MQNTLIASRWLAYASLVLTAVLVIFGWWSGSGQFLLKGTTYGTLRALANLAAFAAAYGILLQLFLIARVPWLDRTFGMDKLARFHHILGFSIPAAIVTHPMLLVAGEIATSGGTWLAQFMSFVDGYQDVGKAAIAAALFLSLVAMSLVIVLGRLKYELWYYAHLIMYAAVLLALGHQFNVGDDMYGWFAGYWYGLYALAFGSLIVFRFATPLYLYWRHGFTVDRVVTEGVGCWSVYLTGRGLESLAVRAGQFFIVRFLDKKRWRQAHPFSLSCVPNGNYLRITIKSLGDYTRDIGSLKPGTRVLLDGPHGAFTEEVSALDKRLLVAGGVGITPIRSLCETMANEGKDVVMLYGARTCADLVFKQEMDELAAKHPNFKLLCVVAKDASWTGETGLVDKEKIARLVPDAVLRDVYVCGPKPMLDSVLSALDSLKVPKKQIHFERFTL